MKNQGERPAGSAARNEKHGRTGNDVRATAGEAGAETPKLSWNDLEDVKLLLRKRGKGKLLRLISILAD